MKTQRTRGHWPLIYYSKKWECMRITIENHISANCFNMGHFEARSKTFQDLGLKTSVLVLVTRQRPRSELRTLRRLIDMRQIESVKGIFILDSRSLNQQERNAGFRSSNPCISRFLTHPLSCPLFSSMLYYDQNSQYI